MYQFPNFLRIWCKTLNNKCDAPRRKILIATNANFAGRIFKEKIENTKCKNKNKKIQKGISRVN